MEIENILSKEIELLEAGEPFGWFWQTGRLAVIMGRSGKAEFEANEPACAEDNVPIISRMSGGGTVMVGAGVLCFGVVLKKEWQKVNPAALAEKVLTPVCKGLSVDGINIQIKGLGDLSYNGRKICGTAQRWLKKSVMLHGTLLVDFDISLLEKYLKHPPKEPDYRLNRKHADFCVNLSEIYGAKKTTENIALLINESVREDLGFEMQWL